ncbi:LacI family DNA-binding transcriptional regulator [Streptomyces mesophilus]|uniref:LacI family DNA-binding transcriptional regulator n=1 Tax=Streptomyces mesophilus TaxID=1775132 RepID=UPI00332A9A9D
MAFAEKRGDYYRARYWIAPGKLRTVVDTHGRTVKFPTKRQAEKAAKEAEVKAREAAWRDPSAGKVTFGEYANRWYAAQDLALSTMEIYRGTIEQHLLPDFEDVALADISPADVGAWEKAEQAVYAQSSVRNRRAVLHLILADAVDEGLIAANPAAKRRGRGRKAGRARARGPEKVVTTPLGILLLAERAALLSGRDDEFVACVQLGYTGMRWGELVGLEREFVRPDAFRVEWQLYELDNATFVRCPPKDDSYRTIDAPEWLAQLVGEHSRRNPAEPCSCHSREYVYRGNSGAGLAPLGAKLVDVARHAGVSIGTASTVLNHPERVPEPKRVRVTDAIAALGYVRSFRPPRPAAHWRRSGFATWLFAPAASGWYPKKGQQDGTRPVPLLADPWPGIPVRGRNAAGRAQACWLPVARGLTPHGLRHTHRTMMEELGTEKVLIDERMGHLDGSISARYTHVTQAMRRRLCQGLTELWEGALAERRAMAPSSPVAVLDRLLKASG